MYIQYLTLKIHKRHVLCKNEDIIRKVYIEPTNLSNTPPPSNETLVCYFPSTNRPYSERQDTPHP